jgi:hypothetical protein
MLIFACRSDLMGRPSQMQDYLLIFCGDILWCFVQFSIFHGLLWCFAHSFFRMTSLVMVPDPTLNLISAPFLRAALRAKADRILRKQKRLKVLIGCGEATEGEGNVAINHHTESYPINPPMLMAGLLIPIKCSLNGLKPYSIICLIWEMGYAAIYGLWLGQYIISCHIISYMYNIHISTG